MPNDSKGGCRRTSVGSSILSRDRRQDTGQGARFAQLMRRPSSGGRKLSSKISAADGLLPNLKSSPTSAIERARRGGVGPPTPADAVAPDLGREDVVGNQGLQTFEFQIARSAVHPANDLIDRALGLLDGKMVPGNKG